MAVIVIAAEHLSPAFLPLQGQRPESKVVMMFTIDFRVRDRVEHATV